MIRKSKLIVVAMLAMLSITGCTRHIAVHTYARVTSYTSDQPQTWTTHRGIRWDRGLRFLPDGTTDDWLGDNWVLLPSAFVVEELSSGHEPVDTPKGDTVQYRVTLYHNSKPIRTWMTYKFPGSMVGPTMFELNEARTDRYFAFHCDTVSVEALDNGHPNRPPDGQGVAKNTIELQDVDSSVVRTWTSLGELQKETSSLISHASIWKKFLDAKSQQWVWLYGYCKSKSLSPKLPPPKKPADGPPSGRP